MGSSDPGAMAKPIPIPTQEKETRNPAAALLSSTTDSSSSAHLTAVFFCSFVLITCIALSAAATFAFLFFSKSSTSHLAVFASFANSTARPFSKLNRSVVLLVSSDGFRFGYQFKTSLPNINRLIAKIGEAFTMQSRESKWWLGEPLWETVANHGFRAATYFWPGSEITKGSWSCPSNLCMHYNASVPFEERVDTILNYFDLPKFQK